MKEKILIIDDDAEDREKLKEKLKEAGYENILEAAGAEEGVAIVQRDKPDLAIVDTVLPKIDGFEVCREIKNIKGVKTKVIVFTGVLDVVNEEKAREMKADNYCVKTADYFYVLETVKKTLSSVTEEKE